MSTAPGAGAAVAPCRPLAARSVLRGALLLAGLAVLWLAGCSDNAADGGGQRAAARSDSGAGAVTGGSGEGAAESTAAAAVVLRAWTVVTDQRRDVLELTAAEARALLAGEIDDWAALGGRATPVHVYLARGEAAALARAFGLPPGAFAGATVLPDTAAVLDRVAGEAGAVAAVPPAALRPGVLAPLIAGYDPFRDPPERSPLVLRGAPGDADPAGGEGAAPLEPFPLDLDPVQLVATGELIPARCTHEALVAAGDPAAAFAATGTLLRAAELAVSQLEVPLTDVAPPTPCVETFVLSGAPGFVDAIADTAGIDVLFAIGNHMLDCWGGDCARGSVLLDTLARLDRAGVVAVGAGADLAAARSARIVERGGLRFAFLGYDSIAAWNHAAADAPGVAPMEAAMVAADVAAARAQADHVIVGMNWGTEYTPDPTPFQRELAATALDAGATLVVGNHPHWVQATELRAPPAEAGGGRGPAGLAVYALGNFVFDQDWSVETTQSAVLEAGFSGERLLGFRLRPVVLRGDANLRRGLFRPEFVDPAGEGRPILDRIWDASARIAPLD